MEAISETKEQAARENREKNLTAVSLRSGDTMLDKRTIIAIDQGTTSSRAISGNTYQVCSSRLAMPRVSKSKPPPA